MISSAQQNPKTLENKENNFDQSILFFPSARCAALAHLNRLYLDKGAVDSFKA